MLEGWQLHIDCGGWLCSLRWSHFGSFYEVCDPGADIKGVLGRAVKKLKLEQVRYCFRDTSQAQLHNDSCLSLLQVAGQGCHVFTPCPCRQKSWWAPAGV